MSYSWLDLTDVTLANEDTYRDAENEKKKNAKKRKAEKGKYQVIKICFQVMRVEAFVK